MKDNERRRKFFKLTLATGCLAAFGKSALANNSAEPDCNEKINRKADEVWLQELHAKIRLLKKLKEKLGDEVTQIAMRHTVSNVEKQYSEMDIQKRDLDAIKSLLWDTMPKEKFEYRKIKDTGAHLEFRVSRCRIAEAVRDLNEPELAYALVCAWDEGFCRGLNSNIKFTRTKTLIRGNEYCNHTYELEKTDAMLF